MNPNVIEFVTAHRSATRRLPEDQREAERIAFEQYMEKVREIFEARAHADGVAR